MSFKDEAAITAFAAQDLDIAIVAAYGLILPQAVLDAPRLGCVNIHASLLPRWRGVSPFSTRFGMAMHKAAYASCRWRRGWIRAR